MLFLFFVLPALLGILILLLISEHMSAIVSGFKYVFPCLRDKVLDNDVYVHPAALHPEMAEPWLKILNQLDPLSFNRMGRTCRDMYELCTSGATGLRISMDAKEFDLEIEVTRDAKGTIFECIIGAHQTVVDPENIRIWPFEICEPKLTLLTDKKYPLNAVILEEISSFLRHMRVTTISTFIFVAMDDKCWRELREFNKEFLGDESATIPLSAMTKNQVKYDLENAQMFLYKFPIANDLLTTANCGTLVSLATTLKPRAFSTVLKRWLLNGVKIDIWAFGYLYNHFADYINAIGSMVPFHLRFNCDYVGDLPFARPLLFCYGVSHYWILREDDTVINFYFEIDGDPKTVFFVSGDHLDEKTCGYSFPHALDKSLYLKI